MNESLFSPLWYRIAALRPRLRSHAAVHRHDYRNEIWYVLEDQAAGRAHRFTPTANHLIGLMDGERDMQAIWESAAEQLGDGAPTQSETIAFLGQLHAANVLQCDVPPDTLELFRRHQKHQRTLWTQRFASPLALRIPLLDPDRFLRRWQGVVRPLFGWFGFVLWAATVLAGVVLAALHWPELTGNLIDRVLSVNNLALLLITYPFIKALHELGHAFAIRCWDGEVHEMGVMLLVLMPVPYVEASAASAFREKHRRMVVSAAGIMVELWLAALAVIVWVNVESGLVSALAFNVMLIGGVSTLFFNGNPLLRFDGYYVLADAIEIPNLATRSRRYLVQRRLFGIESARSPALAAGERGWFIAYGVASMLYRLFIMAVIVLYIAGKFFFIGVLLAAWAVATQLILPMLRNTTSLFKNRELRQRRVRTLSTAASIATLVGIALLLPVPSWTRAEGVVWLSKQAQVRAEASGFVREMLVEDGAQVPAGTPLVAVEDALLAGTEAVLEARVREFDARFTALEHADRSAADVARQQRESAAADLERARERVAALTVHSETAGVFVSAAGPDWPGRFVHRGELVGHVIDPSRMTVRVVVEQDDIGMVRQRTRFVEARLATRGATPVPARVLREVPGGSYELPSPALSTDGGGRIVLDPRSNGTLRTLQRVFQYELALPDSMPMEHAGARVHVRFDHGREPLAAQGYRLVKQLLLSRFGV